MSGLIPLDLLQLILEKLPAKDLCRFCCVCTAWKSLITSSAFIFRHLSATAANPPSRRILVNKGNPNASYKLYPSDDISPTAFPQNLRFPFQSMTPVTKHTPGFETIGVLNGVICLYSIWGFILWNPSISRYVELPLFTHKYNRSLVSGLGFDSTTNDFKLVSLDSPSDGCVIEVISARSGVCSVLDPNPALRGCEAGRSIFLNGDIHWEGHRRCNDKWRFTELFVFDCRTHQLSTLGLPHRFIEKRDVTFKDLCARRAEFALEFRGMLAVLDYDFPQSSSSCTVNIWVMKEYGVVDSWSNLFAIEVKTRFFPRVFMARENDEDEIIMFNNYASCELTSYDIKTGVRKEGVRIRNERERGRLHVCAFEPSLMLLDVERSRSYQDNETVYLK